MDLGRDILSEVTGLDIEGDGLACHCFYTHLYLGVSSCNVYMYGCLVGMDVSAPCACLVVAEARRRCQIS